MSVDPTNDVAGDIFEEIVGDTLDSIENNLSYIIDEYLNTSAVRGKSECCGASPWLGEIESERCGDCKEWTEFIPEE